jgi:hypothetical protein
MKKKLFYNFLLFLFISISSVAQKKVVKFQSINLAGIVGGENHVNSAFQTINGIKFSDLFAGIGIGVDNYRYKTLPLFIDGRWYFGYGNKAFLYGDIGYNFPMKNKPGKETYFYSSYDFSGGVYTDFGVGLQFPLNRFSSLAFSLGHSYKELQNKVAVVNQCLVAPCPVDYSRYNYELGRMILKAGIVF